MSILLSKAIPQLGNRANPKPGFSQASRSSHCLSFLSSKHEYSSLRFMFVFNHRGNFNSTETQTCWEQDRDMTSGQGGEKEGQTGTELGASLAQEEVSWSCSSEILRDQEPEPVN